MTVGDGRLPLRLAKEQPCGFDPGSVLQIVLRAVRVSSNPASAGPPLGDNRHSALCP
jgi:hypothetical protein